VKPRFPDSLNLATSPRGFDVPFPRASRRLEPPLSVAYAGLLIHNACFPALGEKHLPYTRNAANMIGSLALVVDLKAPSHHSVPRLVMVLFGRVD
jgi:hypothetical protein